MTSVPENGSTQFESPAPGTIRIGQSIVNGRIWVTVKVDCPVVNLTVLDGAAEVTLCMKPEYAVPLGRTMIELGQADQVVLSRKEGLVIPRNGSDGIVP